MQNNQARIVKPPAQPLNLSERPQPRFLRSTLEPLVGKRVVVQLASRHGAAPTIRGTLRSLDGFLLTLADATVTGNRHIARPPLIVVNIGHCSHLHPEVEVEEIEPALEMA